jgi:signal peptidase I
MFKNKVMVELISWGKMLFLAFGMFIIISILLFQPYTVNGSSMAPTFEGTDPNNHEKIGDYVLVSKSSYKIYTKPKNGDIVVVDSRTYKRRTFKDELVEHPLVSTFTNRNNNYKWIKRVIGVEGDRIELKNGKLYRNGIVLEEEYILEEMAGSFEAITVPENHVFVLGDNRNHSGDSRIVGSIPYENVIGKVIGRYFPLSKLDLF